MHRITAAEIAAYNADKYIRRKKQIEKIQNEIPQVGPRTKFIHYVFDLKMNLDEAINNILKEFPAQDKENIFQWYYDDKNNRERSNSNEGR